VRFVAAATLVVPLVAALPVISRADTQAELQAARAKYAELNHQIEVLDEQYNAAQIQLTQVESQLADVRDQKAQADAEQATAVSRLTRRAHTAYMDSGSQLDVLLGAGDFTDFSDRLEFLNQLESQDASLALNAQNASQRAEWAAQELSKVQGQKAALVKDLAAKKAAGQQAIQQQQSLIDQLGKKLQAEQAAAAAAAKKARQEAAAAAAAGGTGGTSTGGGGGGTSNPPPVSGSGAQAAVSAAYSVIGTRYVWGGASPNGFDCSGLTMWSWAHGGVSLPHNSAAQYAATPRVDRSQLQPGDLVFFYSPISHVGLYIGGGNMIDASHPGPGGEVAVRPVGGSYAGAGRP
jgi:peptidoglycan DL-endopeptidase CwlO